jgi:hypothetical protein
VACPREADCCPGVDCCPLDMPVVAKNPSDAAIAARAGPLARREVREGRENTPAAWENLRK